MRKRAGTSDTSNAHSGRLGRVKRQALLAVAVSAVAVGAAVASPRTPVLLAAASDASDATAERVDKGVEAVEAPAADRAPETSAEAEGAEDGASDGESEFPPEIEKLLTESSEEMDYAVTERCLAVRSIRDTDILDERHIVFEMAGNKLYLVQFKRRCYDLRPGSTLFFEPRGSRICQLDTIRASRSFGIGPPDMGIPCPIPGFISITPEQVALLRESLKARRKAPSAPPPDAAPGQPDGTDPAG